MTAPARFRHTVTLQRHSVRIDEFGGASEVYTDTETVFAEITTAKGESGMEAGRTQTRRLVQLLVRFGPQIDASMRLRLADGTLLEILSVDDIAGRRQTLVIVAREVVS